MVLTHTKSFKPVITPMAKRYTGELYHVRAMCLDSLHCTEEHPFYVRRMFKKGHESERLFHEPEWIKAKNLDMNCYIGYAINQLSKLPKWDGVDDNRWGHHNTCNKLSELFTNPDFWYLMGRYVGDGWRKVNPDNGNGLVISCSDRNRTFLEGALNRLGKNFNIVKERSAYKCHIPGNEWCAFAERYGYKAGGKRIDGETLALPKELLKSFLDGYIASDGCVVEGRYKTCSISRELTYGIAQCVAKVYNRPFSIYKVRREPVYVIEGRTVNQHDSYNVVWKDEWGKNDHAFYEDGYLWFPLRSIPTNEKVDIDVYNMSVSEDESYTANGVVVHNCQDWSSAGLQRGGAEGTGTRSSLLWECRRAIVSKKPKYLMLENVAALVSEKFMPFLKKWMDELSSYGYTNYLAPSFDKPWETGGDAELHTKQYCLNSKNYGIPQNRERVFLISILGEHNPYQFPKPFPLDKCLMDVLEKDVDEKYYIKDEVVQSFIEAYKNGETPTLSNCDDEGDEDGLFDEEIY